MELDGTSCALAVDGDTSDTDNMAMILTTRLITAYITPHPHTSDTTHRGYTCTLA
jgi:hypothetical protein